MQQRKPSSRTSTKDPRSGKGGVKTLRKKKRNKSSSTSSSWACAMTVIAASLLFMFIGVALVFRSVMFGGGGGEDPTAAGRGGGDNGGSLRNMQKANDVTAQDGPQQKKAQQPPEQHRDDNNKAELFPHLYPPLPPLPPFAPIPNSAKLVEDTLSGTRPTIAGIAAILHGFLDALHTLQMELASHRAEPDEIIPSFFDLAKKHLLPFDEAYRGKPIFPIREDDSVFISLAGYREHLLAETLRGAFGNAANPDKLFVGAVVQNCFGLDAGPDNPKPCKTGVEVVGTNANGQPMTKVSDAPPDKNGIVEFCTDPSYKQYCDAGQIRALYVREGDSQGPAMARYYASKLWGGETFYVQVDSHLQFAERWDARYIDEVKLAKSYPRAILSAYPPGFVNFDRKVESATPGTRLCTCEFSTNEIEQRIIRINTGSSYNGGEDRPTQIPFMAAGFFFVRSEFLVDVPFDPLLPWCFMGEEIALSMRAWTSGWDMYAPRYNLIAHQYRPGRMGLPKFWESVGRLYGRPQMNTRLMTKMIRRVKHMVGYPECTREKVEGEGNGIVLTELEHYGLGKERTWDAYVELANIDVQEKQCRAIPWCNHGTLE